MYFLNGVGEGKKNNLSCSVVLGLFCVVRLLFDFVLWLFRDGLVFFRPWAEPFSILILLRLWLDEKNAFFLLFLACKSRNSGELQAKTPRQTDFFGENRDFGRKFLAS